MENVYLNQIHQNLPRILSLFDNDNSSESYGYGDRTHWAWGLSDFANGTFQGAAHGFARLWVSGLWPYPTSEVNFLRRINSIFVATARITRKSGALEEAFPNEGSYCVTALVAFDLLCTVDLLQDTADEAMLSEWQKIIEPLVEYLIYADELHALITNHLSTAAAALFRWYKITSDSRAQRKATKLLKRITDGQSSEGWFSEYGGFDPGYQTLAIYYLADIYINNQDESLLLMLERSMNFLKNFIHPDGSIGGTYGSRCTRFYVPGGITALSEQLPICKKICDVMSISIQSHTVVGLSEIDELNLIPFFNAYCWSASKISDLKQTKSAILPYEQKEDYIKLFEKAGILIKKERESYIIINIHKGGIVYAFKGRRCVKINSGIIFKDKNKSFGSTSFYDPDIKYTMTDDGVQIYNRVIKMPKKLPTPVDFLILRILSLTLFKSYWIREITKKMLVKLLITRKTFWPVTNTRTIKFNNILEILDKSNMPNGYEKVEGIDEFVPIHMASKGYWQLQNEEK